MASPAKPWKAEYAKSARSSCKTCKSPIDKERFRLGKMVQATQFDGFIPMWHHAECILKKANQIKSPDDVGGIELLRWEDQQKIRKYLEEGGSQATSAPTVMECSIEVSQTSRATCRRCNQKIMKGEVRISMKPEGQGARGLAWHHTNCFMELSPTTQVEKLSGWNTLPGSDQAAVLAMFEKVPSSKKGKKIEIEDDKESSKGGAKRKRPVNDDQKSKLAKVESGASVSKSSSEKTSAEPLDKHPKASNLEIQLEAQAKEIWALKDDLKKHVTTVELREMLEANDQDSTGSELDLRDRCADRMLFGALKPCPLCSGHLHYSGGMYRCGGFLSAWSKCSYSNTEPERVKGKWKIPEGSSNSYLCKWFIAQKAKKPSRVLPQPSSNMSCGKHAVNEQTLSSKGEKLEDLKVAIVGLPKESMDEWKAKIEGAGGQVHAKIKKDTNCLVVSGVLDDKGADMRKARRMKLPIVREDYLVDSIRRQKKLPFDLYKIEAIGEASSMVTVKVKGRSAVHESSGLQDSGHILEDGKSIYNTTLSMSDISTGVNSYYILQIIQEDQGSGCYVFRKWGRVGNDKIGGKKLDDMPKSDAIREFKRLFLEKTGNPWEAWEDKQNFQKQPGRFFPLDIDYGVNKDVSKKKNLSNAGSQLASPLVELMKMLFNVEAYRAAMMEFEINMSEMPLGKLSKSNIQKGFEALTEIQNLLSSNELDLSYKESLIVDASNRFFTVIPSIHPHVIRDEDDFKSKVKMLEALQDIEIASRLVGFDVDNDESLDEKYMKLHCDITPVPHDSEDYRLIEKYLNTTHAPTHTDWALELEEVFSLEREGEIDKFAPYREKLGNRLLLWHGSRLTNFVGILSQGLRIAPPEAPATGYMFGKGIYFADLVSKSAQYCYTDKKNPVGLMVLSEVALGEVYELKQAVSDSGLKAVSNCSDLEILHIVKTPDCTNVGIVSIAEHCKKLRKLHIDGWRTNRIGNEGLIAIAKHCANLQELVLIGVNPSSISLEPLASNCQKLERLALCGSETIGDEEISCIAAKCVALKKLCIKGCPVSDRGIETFAWGCPNLVKIKVKKCRGVTSNLADRLGVRRKSLVVNLDVCEVEAEVFDTSGSDGGPQEDGVEFPPVGSHVSGGAAAVAVEAPPSSSNGRPSFFKSRFGLFGGKGLAAWTCRRNSSNNNSPNGGGF